MLERGSRGVSVTESGKVLLARGRWLLGAVDDIKAEVRTENREPSGTVRLGAPSSSADILYAPLAKLLVRRFPRVQMELSEGLTEVMSIACFAPKSTSPSSPPRKANDHLAYETLVIEQVFLIGPPRDPLLRSATDAQEFNNLPAAVVPLSRNMFPSKRALLGAR